MCWDFPFPGLFCRAAAAMCHCPLEMGRFHQADSAELRTAERKAGDPQLIRTLFFHSLQFPSLHGGGVL